MLTAADAELARRETRVTAFGLVLDPAALRDRLAARLPEAPRAVRVDYLRYKPGTSVLAGLVLDTGAGPVRAYAKAFTPEGAPEKLAKHRGLAARAAAGAGGGDVSADWHSVVDEPAHLVVGTARADRRLPGVGQLAERPGRATGPDASVRTLRYKPERRWVGVLGHERPARLLKAHPPARAAAALAGHRALAAAGLPVPAAERVHPQRCRGLLSLAWVHGTALDAAPADERVLAEVGALLARVHAVAPALAAGREAAPARPGLDAAAAAVGVLLPGLAAEARAVARTAAARLADRPRTVVHGDFSADQVMVAADGVWLTDLDQVRIDDPLADLGGYLAAEIADGRVPPGTDPYDALAPLLAGYRPCGARLDRRALAAHTAAALLRRTAEPFRHRHPDWPVRAATLLTAARDLLEQP
ncbi:phosphotransferase [Allonocardiopsis opalescens]|uniref:Ser/Thr protein kinase RdoA (MazF antagonist) n=1 Tax=Allonocardiopsis opalescens TaxID=1144618 RepID=A0A2T0Q004_9ACTN|nr:phosphotransferase [Allonocardiopsis opalescens]PRX97131.1 Ser/Thr protein kinase RdoA (MazF antagonist) [Allonocardiopsis opalescens]